MTLTPFGTRTRHPGSPQIVSGAVITEGIFSWPGMELLAFQATVTRDYPVILGVVMLVAALTVLFNLLADIATILVTPRLRTSLP